MPELGRKEIEGELEDLTTKPSGRWRRSRAVVRMDSGQVGPILLKNGSPTLLSRMR